MARGNRKHNGKFIFIPSESRNDAIQRRAEAVYELAEVKRQLADLQRQEADWKEQVECLNGEIRSVKYQPAFDDMYVEAF